MTQTAKSVNKQQGFTLLEVLIAITLTALVLGNLFALQSQSKRLSYKAQINIQKNINQRAYFNAAWISSRQLDSYMDELFRHSDYSVDNKSALNKPQTQVKALNFSLESFAIVDQKHKTILKSVRIKQSDVLRR